MLRSYSEREGEEREKCGASWEKSQGAVHAVTTKREKGKDSGTVTGRI